MIIIKIFNESVRWMTLPSLDVFHALICLPFQQLHFLPLLPSDQQEQISLTSFPQSQAVFFIVFPGTVG